MNSIRSLVKDSAIYGAADLVTKLLAFCAFPFIAVALSPLAFGVLELIITSTALLGMIMSCGLNNSVQRFYWDKDTAIADRPVVVSSGLVTFLIFGILAFLFGGALLPVILTKVEQGDFPLTWVALVAALVLMVLSRWLQFLLDVTRLHFAPLKFFTLSIISRVLGLSLGVIAVVWMGWGIDGLLAVQALAALFTFPIALWMVKKDITLKISKVWFKQLVGYGYPFIFVGLAYWLFGSMDRWMLATMSSVEEVGIYSVAFRFASVVLFVSVAFGRAWSPYAIKLRTDFPDTYRDTYSRVLQLLLFFMLIVGGGVALFSGEIIGLVMPKEYGESAISLAILCFGIVLQSTQQVTAIGISLEKKTFLFVRIAWLSAVVNFLLNLILIPVYGGYGAAWATTVSYLVLTGSYIFFTQRFHPIPIPWKKIVSILILGGGVMYLSIKGNALVISWELVLFKLIVAITCIVISLKMLSIRTFNFGK